MNSLSLCQTIRILYIPPYYEKHFDLVLDRFKTHNKHIEYQIYTINKNFSTTDLNLLLSICRIIIKEEHIQILISDSYLGHLIVAKLSQEYSQLYNYGMNFLNTLKCLNRFLMIELFGIEECIPTLLIDLTKDWKKNFQNIEIFFNKNKNDIFIKSLYKFDHQLSNFRCLNLNTFIQTIDTYTKLYKQQYITNLFSFFRIYLSKKQYSFLFQPNYLIQPFFDLIKYPHWRLVIANACIFNKEILMWPLVDGYSGWPFLTDKPLGIIPILICPSRQISSEQQQLIYIRFRKHLNNLITNCNLHYGWIECSYFISLTNEIRLISIKPTYSIYLIEAFNLTNQYGNPLVALVQLSNHQRPETPILNGKTVYLHRLWTNIQEKISINHLINMKEIKRISQINIDLNRYVRLRFQENDIIDNDDKQILIEIGFIQTIGEYYEIGLTNLIEFRYNLLKKPEVFPFIHHSYNDFNQFDPITCLPSDELLKKFHLNEY